MSLPCHLFNSYRALCSQAWYRSLPGGQKHSARRQSQLSPSAEIGTRLFAVLKRLSPRQTLIPFRGLGRRNDARCWQRLLPEGGTLLTPRIVVQKAPGGASPPLMPAHTLASLSSTESRPSWVMQALKKRAGLRARQHLQTSADPVRWLPRPNRVQKSRAPQTGTGAGHRQRDPKVSSRVPGTEKRSCPPIKSRHRSNKFRRRRPSKPRLASKPGTSPTGHASAQGPKSRALAQPEPSGCSAHSAHCLAVFGVDFRRIDLADTDIDPYEPSLSSFQCLQSVMQASLVSLSARTAAALSPPPITTVPIS